MQKPTFWNIVWEDYLAISVRKHSTMSLIVCLFTRPGFLAVFLFRVAALCAGTDRNILIKICKSFLWRLNILLCACDINPSAVIGSGFKLPHPAGIVVGPARVGKNVMMLQNSTLGMRHFTDDENDPKNYPTLGENVIISAGAHVLGSVTVGDNSLVGANAVVTQDVPPNHTAVGVPALMLATKVRKITEDAAE